MAKTSSNILIGSCTLDLFTVFLDHQIRAVNTEKAVHDHDGTKEIVVGPEFRGKVDKVVAENQQYASANENATHHDSEVCKFLGHPVQF